MKKLFGILVLAAFIAMSGTSYAASGDYAFEKAFASAYASSAAINDLAFEREFADALASSQKRALPAPQQIVQNKFENDDAFSTQFRTAFTASHEEIALAMRHKIALNSDASNAAYANAVIGMLKRGVKVKGVEQALTKELYRIGYRYGTDSASN